MKKVLIFSHEWPPFIGGVGTVGFQFAKWFSNNDCQVTVITRKQDGVIKLPNVNLIEVDTAPFFWFISYRKFFKKNINLKDFDTIILNECAPTISSVGILDLDDFKKTSILVHGLEIENIYSNRVMNILRRLFLFKVKHERACRNANRLIFVGNFMKQKFIKQTSSSYETKSEVIYAGIDTNVFNVTNLKSNPKTLNVVSASRITEMKGYNDKYTIMRELINTHREIFWHVCGDGDYLFKLKERAIRDGIDDRVIFHGPCSRENLNSIYSYCDIYLLLSKYDEALPLSYVEAQMSGLYAIGMNRGGVIETIADGITGKLVSSSFEAKSIISEICCKRSLLPIREDISQHAMKFDMNLTLKGLSKL